jgi:signal transduction histidine kinase
VFEAFHQLDASSTRRYGGTGLGLALVKEIVSAHGSNVSVKSGEGQGSTFSFPLLAVIPVP